jgi:hypothetical protein
MNAYLLKVRQFILKRVLNAKRKKQSRKKWRSEEIKVVIMQELTEKQTSK